MTRDQHSAGREDELPPLTCPTCRKPYEYVDDGAPYCPDCDNAVKPADTHPVDPTLVEDLGIILENYWPDDEKAVALAIEAIVRRVSGGSASRDQESSP